VHWKSSTEVEDLSHVDIGVMPLPNDATHSVVASPPPVCSSENSSVLRIGSGSAMRSKPDAPLRASSPFAVPA